MTPVVFLAVVELGEKTARFELLETLEFSPERKRMSVVVRECVSGRLKLYTKGADETIFPRLRTGEATVSIFYTFNQTGAPSTVCRFR